MQKEVYVKSLAQNLLKILERGIHGGVCLKTSIYDSYYNSIMLAVQHQGTPTQLVEGTRVTTIAVITRSALRAHFISHLLHIEEA